MKKYNLKQLNKMANTLRQDVIKMLAEAGSGHSAGSLGMADIFAALYFKALNHKPKKPNWANRDRLILSCGHIAPIRYAAMARSGFFPVKELKTLRKLGSRLQGHPSLVDLPGLENSSGPLGQGVSVAVGKALAAKMNRKRYFVYCITSDGEQDEGQTWEAIMLAAKYKLDNLIFIIDRNKIQIDGYTQDIMPLEPLKAKYEAFNWFVIETDGNDMEKIIKALELVKRTKGQPKVIIAKTVPGKGVSFMANKWEWHGKALSKLEAEAALEELQESALK